MYLSSDIKPEIKLDVETRHRYNFRIFDGNLEISRASVILDYKEAKKMNIALLEDVWTHESYRRKGLSSSLIKEIIQFCNTANVYKLRILKKW